MRGAAVVTLMLSSGLATMMPLAGQQNAQVAPSARFPAAWYTNSPVIGTMPPVTGAPYEARVFLSSPYGSVPEKDWTLQARDAAGRTRTESSLGPRTTQGGEQGEVREVGVNDPVSQCAFTWEEPWAAQGTPTATVRCQRQKAEYAGQPMWASTAAMKPGQSHPSPDETDDTEALGERTFDGVRAVGFHRVRTISGTSAAKPMVIESEIWTSPEMKEIVAVSAKGEQGYSIELRQIRLHEPDARLFYPPAGYKIECTGCPAASK